MSSIDGKNSGDRNAYGLFFHYMLQLVIVVLLHALTIILFYWDIHEFAYIAFTTCITVDTVLLGISSRSQNAVKNEMRLDSLTQELLRNVRMVNNIYNELVGIIREFFKKPREVR